MGPVNWCQHWFEYFPNPPLNILAMVENVLAHHDRKLLQHLVNCNITSQVYVWPLLETLFSEVLTRDEWLRLFDSVFSNHPSFLLMACVAYIICCRQPLLKSFHKQDFEVTNTFWKKDLKIYRLWSLLNPAFFRLFSVFLPPS